MQEDCGVCGKTVPFSVTAHVMLNPSGEEAVRDYYVCSDCYGTYFAGLFEAAEEDELADSTE